MAGARDLKGGDCPHDFPTGGITKAVNIQMPQGFRALNLGHKFRPPQLAQPYYRYSTR